MRIAALYDIHGNLDALDSVLDEIGQSGVDQVIVGGDVLPGPQPRQTLERLLDLEMPVQFIHGNGDRVVLAQMRGGDISEVPESHQDVIRWTAQQLHPSDEHVLAGWPATCRIEIGGLGQILFCHATPRNDTDIFTRATREECLLPIFKDVDASIVVCGHTHMQFDRPVAGVRILNAGSVGMPFAQPSGAYWLLLGPDVQLRRTGYDLASAAARIRATDYPRVEELAVRYVLRPPTEAESLEMFAAAELR